MAPVHGENLPLTHADLVTYTLGLDPAEAPDTTVWPDMDND